MAARRPNIFPMTGDDDLGFGPRAPRPRRWPGVWLAELPPGGSARGGAGRRRRSRATQASGTTSPNPFQFTGRENDPTGLYYLRARYYNPTWGRFISEDPIGLNGNLYAYVNNDPLDLVDLLGLFGQSSFQKAFTTIASNPALLLAILVTEAAGGGPENLVADAVVAAEVTAAEGASGLGDLTVGEVNQIQSVVDAAGRPLDVVGSAANGARTAASDIDYTTANANFDYFEGLQDRLPAIDPEHGLLRGYADPSIGPSIRFEPGIQPYFIPGGP